MGKIQVSKEEFEALDNYLSSSTVNIGEQINYYIKYSDGWDNAYKSLRKMGFEKFVKCLVQGYEIEFNTDLSVYVGNVKIAYNYNIVESLRNANAPIFIAISNGAINKSYTYSLTINDMYTLINGLQELLNQLKLIRSDI
jgi:hypothetical protein